MAAVSATVRRISFKETTDFFMIVHLGFDDFICSSIVPTSASRSDSCSDDKLRAVRELGNSIFDWFSQLVATAE